jgi:hypothetical protein
VSWYYTDWSWVQRTVDVAVVLVLVALLAWAALEAGRRHDAGRRGSSGRSA